MYDLVRGSLFGHDSLFDSFFGTSSAKTSGLARNTKRRSTWWTYTDKSQTKAALTLEVPGLGPEDLEVTVRHQDSGYVVVRTTDQKNTFSYSLSLPQGADSSTVQAAVKNGLLTLTVGFADTEKEKETKVLVTGG